ncbi:MAG: hypothetical protein AB7I19_03115 [Planctomycetota bacterium]
MIRNLSLSSLCALGLAWSMAAQVPISGSLVDGSGGPLQSGVVYHASGTINVPAGGTLTVQPGAIVKLASGAFVQISGRLLVNGSLSQPVIFTDLDDDSAGGDTNGNGAVPPTAGRYGSLVVNDGGELRGSQLIVRYAGFASTASIQPSGGGTIDLDGGQITDSPAIAGIRPLGGLPQLNVRRMHFARLGRPVANVSWLAVPGFLDNTAADNAVHDVLELRSIESVVGASLTITSRNTISRVLFADGVSFDATSSVTFEAGVILKIQGSNSAFLPSNAFVCDGTLHCRGTAASPVVFTSFADDAFGGDSNKNGAIPATAGGWRFLTLGGNAANSRLEHLMVRFAGSQGPAIQVACNASLFDCTAFRALNTGLSLMDLAVQPTVHRMTLDGCGITPIGGLRWSSMRNFRDVHITNCAANRMVITSPIVDPNTVVEAHTLHRRTVVADVVPDLIGNASLEFREGVIVKWRTGVPVVVSNGRMAALGTAAAPVVMTSWVDDTFGGDSDDAGPTVGQAGQWHGLQTYGTATQVLEHLRLRCAGSQFHPAILVGNPGARLRALHVDSCAGTGIEVHVAGAPVANCCVHDCRTGIDLTNSPASVIHSTVVACSQFGMRASSGYAGVIANSIAWGNSLDFHEVPAGRLLSSNGSPTHAGSNGNLFADPQFVDLPNRDLRLRSTSPCLEIADAGIADLLRTDFAEASRRTDAFLTGNPRPDMGCHERHPFDLEVAGTAELGESLHFTFRGSPGGVGPLLFSFGGEDGFYVSAYGHLLVGSVQAPVLVAAVLPVGVGYPLVVPPTAALVGLPIAAQGLVFDSGLIGLGSFTQRWRARVAP